MSWKNVNLQDILNKTKDFDKSEASGVTAKEFGVSSLVECFICGKEELTNKSVIPDGWKVVKKYNYTLCPECANNLKKRMGL